MEKKNIFIFIFILSFIFIGIFISYETGKTSIKSWSEDGVILMQSLETGEASCFGCNDELCLDPESSMINLEESESLHCNKDFSLYSENLLSECPDEWIRDEMPCICDDDSCEKCKYREYFIFNGERKELKDFNVPWIRENCNIEVNIVY